MAHTQSGSLPNQSGVGDVYGGRAVGSGEGDGEIMYVTQFRRICVGLQDIQQMVCLANNLVIAAQKHHADHHAQKSCCRQSCQQNKPEL